jgi:uncharacterized BrkB/YihY/UPF0761 family membrane protein
VIAVWLYYTNIVFIVGAELARLYDENIAVKEKIKGSRWMDRLRNWLDDQNETKL